MGKRKKSMKTTRPSKLETTNKTIVDIDYEKLADCVAKAIAKENDVRINTYSITREWMKFIIAPVFWVISILMAVLTVGFFITTISIFNALMDNPMDISKGIEGIISFVLTLMCGALAILAFAAGKEIDKERDRQFVVSVFSGMVSLAALIVALVALVMK